VDAAPELDPLYYLHNFERLCATVHSQYADLLCESEATFLQQFAAAGQSARGLYVRLVSRVGPLFRSEALVYCELEDLDAALAELQAVGLVIAVEAIALDDLLRLYRKAELAQLFACELGERAASMRKADMRESLQSLDLSVADCTQRWQDWNNSPVVQPAHRDAVAVLQVLFFGNTHQGLTDFVLTDLGLARYASYPLDRSFRLFADRTELEEYLQVAVLRELFYAARDEGDAQVLESVAAKLLTVSQAAAAEERRDRLRVRCGRELERHDCAEAALAVYAVAVAAPARERRVRVLLKLGRLGEALALCREIEQQPTCEAEIDFVARQIPLLQKKTRGTGIRLRTN
jgi:hypothetical protein